MKTLCFRQHHLREGHNNPPSMMDVRRDACSLEELLDADRIEIQVGFFVHVVKDRYGIQESFRVHEGEADG